MNCPRCSKKITPDSYFCIWCSAFVVAPQLGEKAHLFRRWCALFIDPVIGVVLWFVATSVVAGVNPDFGAVCAVAFPVIYFFTFLVLLSKGVTPGKMLLDLRVVNQQTGQVPGFGRMFIRELIGRFLSGIFFGLGYIWALFDKNAQAWHDKLAGTVVLKVFR